MFLKIPIREYDIRKCNISALYSVGIINKDTYEKLSNTTKDNRLYTIGMMSKDNPDIFPTIDRVIDETHKEFIKDNNITDDMIYERNHDAIWILGGKSIVHTTYSNGIIQVVCKQRYTSILEVDKMRFYYNTVTGKLHKRYVPEDFFKDDDMFWDMLANVMGYLECGDDISVYKYIHEYNNSMDTYNEFIHKLLDELDI